MSSSHSKNIVYAGTFERVMDGKHRVTIPATWLGEKANEFHVIPNPTEDCLIVMPLDEFTAIEDRINQSTAVAAERRKAIRQFYSRARAITADAQGRILFSEEQCRLLQLSAEVVLVGGRSRFEVWNAERWAAVSQDEHASFRNVATLIGL